jgi:hypothetical protein
MIWVAQMGIIWLFVAELQVKSYIIYKMWFCELSSSEME